MSNKKIIRIALSSFLISSIITCSSSAVKVTAIENTNIHRKASISSNILTAMKKGTSTNTILLTNSGKWAKISVNGETGYAKSSSLKFTKFSYDLQTNYPNISYTTSSGLPSGATIYSGGCAPTSLGNVLRNLCGIDEATTQKMCSLATASGARYDGGTSASELLKAAKAKWGGFNYKYTSSYSEMKKHVKSGGMAIAHTPGSSGGASSLFSNSGHFVSVTGMNNNNLVVVDPYWFSGKWTANSVRKENITVTDTKGKVIVKNDAVSDACDYYYLISVSNSKK